MAVGDPDYPFTADDVSRNFMGRRAALIKALTTDVETFFARCHPERENLCLYGFPDGKWELNLPPKELSDLPQPAVGINFSRDGMPATDWLYLVAVHSNSWLLAVTFCEAALNGFDKADRERLFTMVNNLPTISEVVTVENAKKEESTVSSHASNQSASSSKGGGSQSGKYSECSQMKDKDKASDEEDHEGHGEILCGVCVQSETSDEFWICCDTCNKWFHGKCMTVRVTPPTAEHIQQYECFLCSHKRARP